ncbi:unnamed protein product [Sphagnum balticum]
MAHKHQIFASHHHEHHHGHTDFLRPHSIDTNLGLYALKKLNTINQDILTEREAIAEAQRTRSDQPLALEWLDRPEWELHLLHLEKFWGKKVPAASVAVIALGLYGSLVAFEHGSNFLRELLWTGGRSRLVNKYKNLYGRISC